MKTYEQKYKEALERAKNLHKDAIDMGENIRAKQCEIIFPELAESEDEKVREELIRSIKSLNTIEIWNGIKRSDILAWLEKQQGGKDKFTQQHSLKEDSNVNDETNAPTEYGKYVDECLNEAAKHFFSEGEDKYSVADLFYAGVRCGKSWLEKQGQKKYIDDVTQQEAMDIAVAKCFEQGGQKPVDNAEPNFHEGDWVVYNNDICQIARREEGCNKLVTVFGIEKELVNERNLSTARLWTIQDAKDGDVLARNNDMLSICIFSHFDGINDKFSSFLCHCGLEGEGLGQELSINGYHDDSKDYVPATKEQRDLFFQKMHEAGYEWDAEKKELKNIHVIDEGKAEMDYCFTKMMKGEKVTPAWSEEDEKTLNEIFSVAARASLRKSTLFGKSYDYIKWQNWLKSLRDRVQPQNNIVTDKELAQAKKEAYNETLDKIEYHSGEPTFDDGWNAAIWYLKKRNGRPQNTWKPSKEQMEVLLSEVEGWTKGCPKQKVLESLYNDLKKLK